MSRSELGFEEALLHYRKHLAAAARLALETAHPDYVAAFSAHFRPGGTGPEMLAAMQAVDGMGTPKFDAWRQLLLDVVEVDMAAVRAMDAIRALNVVPPDDALDALGIGIGRWLDYQIMLWSVAARALIQRTEDLVTRCFRRLIKGVVEADLAGRRADVLDGIEPFKSYVKDTRDPYAHSGGFVVGVAKHGNIERAILSELWPDATELLDGLGRWHQPWAQQLAVRHQELFRALGGAFVRLDACVPWSEWKLE
jgi:hypothetical protein